MLPGFWGPERLPFVFSRFPLRDFAGIPINPVSINRRSLFRIAAAFGIVRGSIAVDGKEQIYVADEEGFSVLVGKPAK
jgi:hypothetical protein